MDNVHSQTHPRNRTPLACCLIALLAASCFPHFATAQSVRRPIEVFGYFQNGFEQQYDTQSKRRSTTFVMQQLNLFFQKELGNDLTSFVNFETVNSFSSYRRWGAFNLEEAWLRYRTGRSSNIKVGLQIPIFNNLNEISNRTPILPYALRPLVYETSFNEIIPNEEYVPNRAFVHYYGFHQTDLAKIDYAAYLGNGPNINGGYDNDQTENSLRTGVDTSQTVLVGGRVGLRSSHVKVGLSGTLEHTNLLKVVDTELAEALDIPTSDLLDLTQVRLGGDFSAEYRSFEIESEFIMVRIKDPSPVVSLRRTFYYVMLGKWLGERTFGFVSMMSTFDKFDTPIVFQLADVDVPTFGVAVHLSDALTAKGQYAYAMVNVEEDLRIHKERLHYFAFALSVVL